MKSTLFTTIACALALMSLNLAPPATLAQGTSIQVTDWYAAGPLGSKQLENYPPDAPGKPRHEKEFRGMLYWFKVFLHALKDYPMSPEGPGVVDLDATYEGDITINAAGETIQVTWERVTINRGTRYPLAPRMHNGVGMTYFSTWIKAEEPTTVRFFFNGYGGEDKKGNGISTWVNGSFLPTVWMRRDIPLIQQVRPGAEANLKAGWNHVYVRHISAWRGTFNSLVLNVPQALAQGLTISAEPPEAVGRKFKFTGAAIDGDGAVATPAPTAAPKPRPVAKPKPAAKPAPKAKPPVKEDSGVKQFDLF